MDGAKDQMQQIHQTEIDEQLFAGQRNLSRAFV